jgi:hypothetical protein
MFVLRSAFWLAVGFVLVAPHGTDFGAAATAVKDQAIAAGVQAGSQLIASQILTSAVAPRIVASITKSSNPSVDLPMQDSPTAPFVFPRPRPAAMG